MTVKAVARCILLSRVSRENLRFLPLPSASFRATRLATLDTSIFKSDEREASGRFYTYMHPLRLRVSELN
jgi:hypothetical protein